jgi:DNA primase
MRFPPSFIERLRSSVVISEVIGRRIPIKKHGREFHALCPFHNEKTPSFTINDDKGFFHCFGCGAHGDAVSFLMKFEHLHYPESVETLAREAGVPLPEVSPDQVRKFEAEKTLYGALEAATGWFEKQLAGSGGMSARDYAEKRGLKPETVRTFRIGYAPDERTALFEHLKTAGFPQALQAEAGLIIVPEQGAPYDRFRGRLMFPIRSAAGKIIAFGGRLIVNTANKNLPKYLNSPETPLFKKGEVLYNLDLAKKAAREGNMAVVMEGYMDVVASAQSGIAYAVATLGTAITPEHLRLLWQVAKEPVLCLDGDAAGQRAMMRAAEVALPLLKPGFSLRFAMLPNGEDPDTYVQKYGRTSFEKLIAGSRRLSQIMWENVSPQFNTETPEGRAALEAEFKKLTDAITDATVKAHYSSYFRKMLWATGNDKKSSDKQQPTQSRSVHVERVAMAHYSAALETLARRLVSLVFSFPQLLHKSQVEESLSHLTISNHSLDMLRHVMLDAAHHADIDNRKSFVEYVHLKMHGEMPAGIAENKLELPYRDTLSPENALTLWNETVSAYEEEREFATLEESVRQEWNEANSQRLTELKQKRARRTFAPEQEDAV